MNAIEPNLDNIDWMPPDLARRLVAEGRLKGGTLTSAGRNRLYTNDPGDGWTDVWFQPIPGSRVARHVWRKRDSERIAGFLSFGDGPDAGIWPRREG